MIAVEMPLVPVLDAHDLEVVGPAQGKGTTLPGLGKVGELVRHCLTNLVPRVQEEEGAHLFEIRH